MKYISLIIISFLVASSSILFAQHKDQLPSAQKPNSSIFVSTLLFPLTATKWLLHASFATMRVTSGWLAVGGGVVAVVAGVGLILQENQGSWSKVTSGARRTYDKITGQNEVQNLILGNLDKIALGGVSTFVIGGAVHFFSKVGAYMFSSSKEK